MLLWASICLDGLLASHPLQPFHFILHSVSLVIVLEMDLIIWLPNPDRTLPHCPTVQILYKMSVLHYCLLPTWSGLWVLYAHKNPHVILCSCVLSTFLPERLLPCHSHHTFPLLPFKILLIFQVQVQMEPVL